MKDLLEKWMKNSKEETRRFLKFLSVPLIVIVLMIVVVILDKTGQEGKDTESTLTTEEGTPAEAEKETGKAEITLQKEAVPEIHELMEAYFKARKTCDVEALSEVYGGTFTQEELSEQSARMEEEVKFYQDFQNIVCYTAPGAEDGDYLVYARFDIKFRQAETLAPSLIVCYANTAADGSVYLTAGTSPEQTGYMDEANQSEEVQAMAEEVNDGLEKALKSDENLLAVYHILMDEKEESEGTDDPAGSSESQAEETETVSESESEPENT
ncbi:hypothetical protein AALB39_06230 [Lachnospiraceae bacterium 54-53]